MAAARGFCEHGKVWTTCPICGKEVIAAAANKRPSADEFADIRPRKPAVKAPPEEPPEEPAEESAES